MVKSTPRYGFPIIEHDDHVRTPANQAKLANDINRVSSMSEMVAAGLDHKITAAQGVAQDAQDTAALAAQEATTASQQVVQHEPRISALETLGSITPGDTSDATLASLVTQSDSAVSQLLKNQFQPKHDTGQTPYDFGAIGDGVADDTTALKEWINSPQPDLPFGEFLLTETLEVSKDNLTIRGEPGSTIKLGGNHRFITNDGDNTTISGITVDGDGVGQGGIYVNGNHTTINNATLNNFHSGTDVRALQISGEGGSRVYGNTISNVVGTPNESGTVSRGIVLTYPNGASFMSEVFENHIEHVEGGEGVAIAVNCPSNGAIHPPSLTKIYGNTFNGVSRRYLKIQGSKTTVQNNTFHDTFTIVLSQPLHLISAINSDDINIEGNIFKITSPSNGVSIVATDDNRFQRGVIANNTIDAPGYAAQASTRQGEDATIIGNTITVDSGTAIAETDVLNSIVSGNTIHGFSPIGDSWDVSMIINLQSNCVNAVAVNNTALVQPRPTRIVSNTGEGGRSENNILF